MALFLTPTKLRLLLCQVTVGVLLLITSITHAQITLTFSGLKRTQLPFIAVNIDGVELSGHGDTLIWLAAMDTSALLAFRQNLINLPQVQEAKFTIKRSRSAKKNHVHWELREAQTVVPLFSFGGVKGNVNFLFGVNDQHLFGRGHELLAFYQNIQGEHNFLVAYKNPTIRNSRFGVLAEVRRYAAEEPVFFAAGRANYLYTNQNISLGGSYRFTPRQVVNIGATLFRESFDLLGQSSDVLQAPASFRVNKLLLKTGHSLDRRNYISERVSGTDHNSVVELVLNTNDQPFLIGWHEFRKYGLVGSRGNWASRIRLGVASNRDSPFAPFVLDSQVNIRGSGNRIDRGSAQAVFNLEYRHLVWNTSNRNIAVQVVGFSDLGSWRAPGGRLVELTDGSTLRHFVGGGLRLISAIAKNAVLRVDYGVDVRNAEERGFVVGFGQYF